MSLNTMEFYKNDTRRSMGFHLNLSYVHVTDLIAFVKIIEVNFGGQIARVGRFWRETGKAFGVIIVEFPDSKALSDANQHCNLNLTSTGRVKSTYVGALDKMDRGRFQSAALLATINNSSFSN